MPVLAICMDLCAAVENTSGDAEAQPEAPAEPRATEGAEAAARGYIAHAYGRHVHRQVHRHVRRHAKDQHEDSHVHT